MPLSNRAHSALERDKGEELLCQLVNLLQPKRLVAIGNDAQASALRIDTDYTVFKVRHPSYGGQTQFIAEMYSLYGIVPLSE